MHKSVTLLVVGLLTIWGNAPAKAEPISCLSCEGGSIDFYLGTPLFDHVPGGLPSQADEKEIHLNKDIAGVTSFTGDIKEGHPPTASIGTAQFETDVAVDLGNGFANVKPSDKDEKIGTLAFSVPGSLFGDFLFDVQLDKSGTGNDKEPYPLSIVAYDPADNSGILGSWIFGPADDRLKGSADLSFLVLSALSNIDHVIVSSLLGPTGVHGILDIKHFQVSELTPTTVIPLPAALPLFAGGLGLMGWMARRRRGQPLDV